MHHLLLNWCGIHRSDQRLLWLVLCILIVVGMPVLPACRPPVSPTGTTTEATAPPPVAQARPAGPTAHFSEIRSASVAGAFYPADPAQVEWMLDRFLAPVRKVDGTPIALIVPHAGWVYSGHVAAYAYKQIESGSYDAIVVIAPNHTDPAFKGVSVYARGAFQTPLGPSPIDEGLAAEIMASDDRIVFDRYVHQGEHSIEVQLPFLHRTCPGCPFVPIIIGEDTAENRAILTEALTNVLRGKKALLIASSDLSHYPKYEDAIKVDMRTLSAIETMDNGVVSAVMAAEMAENVPGLVTCACGHGPIAVALRVSEALGADRARILHYANSGDVGGDHDRVVGYASVMFWQWEPPELTDEQKAELLGIARQILEEHLSTGITPAIDPPESATLRRPLGAFVTLTLDGELRGCAGNAQGDKPLFEAVARAAVDAAISDSRFPPLNSDELNRAEIEVSVLSPFKRARDVHENDEIEVGRHGLYVLSDGHQGLLLPQVPVNEGWGRAEFLEQVCYKAGLPGGCWEWAAVYTFTAEVFSEARDSH